MIQFKEDSLVLEIPTTEPITVYLRILESLCIANYLLSESNDTDLSAKAIGNINFFLGLNLLTLHPDQLKHLETTLFS